MSSEDREKGLQIRVELDDKLVERFERIQESLGIASRADVIRHLIAIYPLPPPRFEHINTYEDRITIKDNVLNKNANIYLKEGGLVHCDICGLDDCQHIDYALNILQVIRILNAKGWRRKH